MKIIACLCWYDEPVESLLRCVDSLAGSVDGLVAYDGPWELYPDERSQSPPEQTDAILEGWGRSTDLWLCRLAGRWPSQVAKRDSLIRYGAALGADWLLVIDGDESVARIDRDALDDSLSAAETDVARVKLSHTRHPDRGHPVRRLFRALPGLGVEVAHNGYRVEGADGRRRWLAGDPAFVALEQALDVSPLIEIVHHDLSRPQARDEASQLYYNRRRRGRLEHWRRGL